MRSFSYRSRAPSSAEGRAPRLAVVLGLFDLGPAATVIALSLAGLAGGMAMPSRDMMVRAVTPPGSFGKVFGFVTTGFNFAGVLVPLCFGPLMDRGNPVAVFMVIAATALLSVAIVSGARVKRSIGTSWPGSMRRRCYLVRLLRKRRPRPVGRREPLG